MSVVVNENWNRWVFASIAKHLHDAATLADIPLVIHTLDKQSADWKAATTNAEVTIIGPSFRPGTLSTRVRVGVFVIVSSHLTTNNYGHIDAVGAIATSLHKCIDVKDFGTGIGDTGLLEIGVLNRARGDTEVGVVNLAPLSKDTKIHSTISASFSSRF